MASCLVAEEVLLEEEVSHLGVEVTFLVEVVVLKEAFILAVVVFLQVEEVDRLVVEEGLLVEEEDRLEEVVNHLVVEVILQGVEVTFLEVEEVVMISCQVEEVVEAVILLQLLQVVEVYSLEEVVGHFSFKLILQPRIHQPLPIVLLILLILLHSLIFIPVQIFYLLVFIFIPLCIIRLTRILLLHFQDKLFLHMDVL